VAEIISRTVPVGISACLYRCPVRYNGHALDAISVLGRERAAFAFTPVCPECMAGLGVPRAPIHLTGTGAAVLSGEARVRDRHGRDLTEEMLGACAACFGALQRARARVVVVKEASPSCGVYKTRVGGHRREQSLAAGVFGAMLAETGWFLVPDDALANPLRWWDWRRRMHAWLWFADRRLERAADLYEAWHVVKFVLQETSRPFADDMGRRLATLPKSTSAEALLPLRREILDALRQPSDRTRIRQAMWKTYAHMRSQGRLAGVDTHGLDVRPPEVPERVDEIAEQLVKLERISWENDVLVGTTPVVWHKAPRG
jgi:uncharacterized protein YbbK (DUF523 family)